MVSGVYRLVSAGQQEGEGDGVSYLAEQSSRNTSSELQFVKRDLHEPPQPNCCLPGCCSPLINFKLSKPETIYNARFGQGANLYLNAGFPLAPIVWTLHLNRYFFLNAPILRLY